MMNDPDPATAAAHAAVGHADLYSLADVAITAARPVIEAEVRRRIRDGSHRCSGYGTAGMAGSWYMVPADLLGDDGD